MRDPIERLDEFDPGADMNPLPPAEIRRRGERFRRRRQGLTVAGGVLAVALVAVPVGVLAQRDDGGPTPAEPSPTRAPELTEAALLTETEVPARERLNGWLAYELPDRPVLSCAPGALDRVGATDSVRRDFVAGIAGESAPPDDSVPPAAMVQTAVLQFADAAAAEAAAHKLEAWISDCSSPADDGDPPEGGARVVELPEGDASWWTRAWIPAPEYCPGFDCDAALFDRQGFALTDTRLVVVSQREVGGPLEPEGLDESMERLVEAAVAKAAG